MFFPTSDDTSPPVQFDDELVYALSSVRHIREHAPTIPDVATDQKKYLSLTGGIALLLVTEDKADVTAASFVQVSTSVDFYYAKNRLCTPAYIES